MAMPSVRTTTYTYPWAELDAMTNFYGGKRCVISLMRTYVEWSHTLDAALESSNECVSQSLILSCAMTLKMYLLAFKNAYAQTASGSISPTCC